MKGAYFKVKNTKVKESCLSKFVINYQSTNACKVHAGALKKWKDIFKQNSKKLLLIIIQTIDFNNNGHYFNFRFCHFHVKRYQCTFGLKYFKVQLHNVCTYGKKWLLTWLKVLERKHFHSSRWSQRTWSMRRPRYPSFWKNLF